MGNKGYSPWLEVYRKSQELETIFEKKGKAGQAPLTFQDSLSAVPNYPYCAIGLLTAEGKHGMQKGIAFVVADNYLLTCASNCYSHLHKEEYQKLTFNIDSNRKAGIDTHRITKVFVPDQYKQLPEKQRNSFNFALLFIQGEPNLKDRYGSVGLDFQGTGQPLTYSEWILSQTNTVRMIATHKMQNKVSIALNGAPLISEPYGYIQFAQGLAFQEGAVPSFLVFNQTVFYQLAKWSLVENRCLDLHQSTATDILSSLPQLRKQKIKVKPLEKIILQNCQGAEYCQIFEGLSFPSINNIKINNGNIEGNHLAFLKMNKFRKLKELDLRNNDIGILGCKYIAEASLDNLRKLYLDSNKIGSEGCGYLSKTNWPFIKILYLNDCLIGNQGLRLLSLKKWKNLRYFSIMDIMINNQGTIDMKSSSFPRLDCLFLMQTSVDYIGLHFLKSSWGSLKTLNLQYTNLGSKGCKLIKDSGIVFSKLWLTSCQIDKDGMKWLCKADLTELHQLYLCQNLFGNQGCQYLCKANIPLLLKINLKQSKFNSEGMKWLFTADWTQKTFYQVLQQFMTLWLIPDKMPTLVGRIPEKYTKI